MEWYLKVVRDNYANFSGRARRQEYWMFTLINMLIILPLNIGSAALVESSSGLAGILSILVLIYSVVVFIPSLAVVVRRLHDVGKSGWFYFIVLIPLVGFIWILVLFCTEGDTGPNEYGPDPKGGNNEEINEIGKPLID